MVATFIWAFMLIVSCVQSVPLEDSNSYQRLQNFLADAVPGENKHVVRRNAEYHEEDGWQYNFQHPPNYGSYPDEHRYIPIVDGSPINIPDSIYGKQAVETKPIYGKVTQPPMYTWRFTPVRKHDYVVNKRTQSLNTWMADKIAAEDHGENELDSTFGMEHEVNPHHIEHNHSPNSGHHEVQKSLHYNSGSNPSNIQYNQQPPTGPHTKGHTHHAGGKVKEHKYHPHGYNQQKGKDQLSVKVKPDKDAVKSAEKGYKHSMKSGNTKEGDYKHVKSYEVGKRSGYMPPPPPEIKYANENPSHKQYKELSVKVKSDSKGVDKSVQDYEHSSVLNSEITKEQRTGAKEIKHKGETYRATSEEKSKSVVKNVQKPAYKDGKPHKSSTEPKKNMNYMDGHKDEKVKTEPKWDTQKTKEGYTKHSHEKPAHKDKHDKHTTEAKQNNYVDGYKDGNKQGQKGDVHKPMSYSKDNPKPEHVTPGKSSTEPKQNKNYMNSHKVEKIKEPKGDTQKTKEGYPKHSHEKPAYKDKQDKHTTETKQNKNYMGGHKDGKKEVHKGDNHKTKEGYSKVDHKPVYKDVKLGKSSEPKQNSYMDGHKDKEGQKGDSHKTKEGYSKDYYKPVYKDVKLGKSSEPKQNSYMDGHKDKPKEGQKGNSHKTKEGYSKDHHKPVYKDVKPVKSSELKQNSYMDDHKDKPKQKGNTQKTKEGYSDTREGKPHTEDMSKLKEKPHPPKDQYNQDKVKSNYNHVKSGDVNSDTFDHDYDWDEDCDNDCDDERDCDENCQEFTESKDLDQESLEKEFLNKIDNRFRALVFNPMAEAHEKFQSCMTPLNESGSCRYVQHCLFSNIIGAIDKFMDYVCVIQDRFIGVCCPDFPVSKVDVQWDEAVVNLEQGSSNAAIETPEDCGISTKTRIVGGAKADPREYPWMAALLTMTKGQFFCGGSLINNQYILTAAHCTFSVPRNQILVRLGEYDFSHEDPEFPGEDFPVVEIKRHGQYSRRTLQHDIALLKLGRPASFSKQVGTICLPAKEKFVGKTATLAGWGNTKGGGASSDVLLETALPVVNNSACAREHGLSIPESFICTKSADAKSGACNGDSGGPLMLLDDDEKHWKVIGLVSWGRRGCEPKFPTVYTRVTNYLDWINAHAV